MIRPTLEEAKQLAAGHSVIPLALEILSDLKTPIQLLQNIRRQSDLWYILESVSGSDNWGRYSFLGYNPVLSVYGTGDEITITNGHTVTRKTGDPVSVIRELIQECSSPRVSQLPPFTGGLVGYFSYDFVQHFIHGLKLTAANEDNFREFHLMRMDKIVAFDHFQQKIFIIVNIPAEDIENSYISGVTALKDMEKMMFETAAAPRENSGLRGEFTPSFTPEGFGEMVRQVQHHIREGDIFQAVVSNRFKAPFAGNLMNTYRMLRTTSPSPYMCYMHLDDMEIACSSPETLVSLRDGEVGSFPLAGTCPRGGTPAEDAALIDALLADEKELSEHDMLVDLARNDLGKVCEFGSVQLGEYRQVKRFANVSHIASHITGRLRAGMDALDVIAAALPAGTLSGAPKKRACEIIDHAEGVRRGVYGGAIGYIDFAGNMDMCIGIRMAFLKDGNVFVQSGAGIVADSVPEKEYQETQNKARAVMEALRRGGEV